MQRCRVLTHCHALLRSEIIGETGSPAALATAPRRNRLVIQASRQQAQKFSCKHYDLTTKQHTGMQRWGVVTHCCALLPKQDCWGQLHPQQLWKQHMGATDP